MLITRAKLKQKPLLHCSEILFENSLFIYLFMNGINVNSYLYFMDADN